MLGKQETGKALGATRGHISGASTAVSKLSGGTSARVHCQSCCTQTLNSAISRNNVLLSQYVFCSSSQSVVVNRFNSARTLYVSMVLLCGAGQCKEA